MVQLYNELGHGERTKIVDPNVRGEKRRVLDSDLRIVPDLTSTK